MTLFVLYCKLVDGMDGACGTWFWVKSCIHIFWYRNPKEEHMYLEVNTLLNCRKEISWVYINWNQ
jgi:hypothetical protein